MKWGLKGGFSGLLAMHNEPQLLRGLYPIIPLSCEFRVRGEVCNARVVVYSLVILLNSSNVALGAWDPQKWTLGTPVTRVTGVKNYSFYAVSSKGKYAETL